MRFFQEKAILIQFYFQRPELIVVCLPTQGTFHGIVNIIGYLQDVQLRLHPHCILVQSNDAKVLPTKVLKFYKINQYEAFEWGLRGDNELVSFAEKHDRLKLIA